MRDHTKLRAFVPADEVVILTYRETKITLTIYFIAITVLGIILDELPVWAIE